MRSLLVLSVLAICAVSQAATLLTLDQDVWTISPSSADPHGVTITGTIDNTNGDRAIVGFAGINQELHGINTYQVDLEEDSIGWLSHDTVPIGQIWHGNLLRYKAMDAEVHPGQSPYLIAKAVLAQDNFAFIDYGTYRLNVVPEPGSFAALGLGAIVLLRRKRR